MNPPKPVATTEEPTKQRRRRVHFEEQNEELKKNGTSPKILPLSQIRQGLPIMLSLDEFDGLLPPHLSKLHFWGELATRPSPHLFNLPNGQKGANESLVYLKNRGWVTIVSVPEYLIPGDFRSLRTHHYNVLTLEGSKVLAKAMGNGFKSRWRETLGEEIYAWYDPINRADRHRLLTTEILCNLAGAFRQHGGVIEELYVDDHLKRLIRSRALKLRRSEAGGKGSEPDGLILVRFPSGRRAIFIEADTGSQDLGVIADKAKKYGEYFRERFPTDPFFSGYTEYQVLFVTGGGWTRAANIKTTIENDGGRLAYAATTLEYITAPDWDACGQVWMIPTMKELCAISTDPLITLSDKLPVNPENPDYSPS